MVSSTLILRRVVYGKDNVPLENREYNMGPGTPCGTVSELKEFYAKKYDCLMLMDKNLIEVEQVVYL